MKEKLDAALAMFTKEDGDCVIWTGRTSSSNGTPKLMDKSLKRVKWEMNHGPLKKNEVISSSCGNRLCVEHLEKITRSEVSRRINAVPSVKKRKAKKAAELARSQTSTGFRPKMTMEAAQALRESTDSNMDAAKRLGVSHSLVWLIRTNKAWKSYAPDPFAGLGARHGRT